MNWNKIGWVVAIEVAILMVVASFFLPGGDDLHRFYRPFADDCLQCGFVPYFAQWLLWPLSLIPPYLVWPVWSALNAGILLGLCRLTRVNPALLFLSFPALGQFWLGQIDAIVCLGLVLALLANNPYTRGLGIALALVKPQIAALAVFFLLTREAQKDILKILTIPLAVLTCSLIVFGLAWPLDWLINVLSDLPVHVWRLASRDVWPYGIFLILIPFAFRGRRTRFEAGLLVAAMATPFFGVYSYITFLIFRATWWSLPLSYAWVLAYPMWGKPAMRLAWMLPAALLAHLIYENVKRYRTEQAGGSRLVEVSTDDNLGSNQ